MNAASIVDHFSVEDGQLYMDGINLVELARKYGTPLFVFSESRIRENVRRIVEAFSRRGPVGVYYAVKANSNLSILKIIRDEGIGAEAVSYGEIYKALRAGFAPDRIVFNGPGKTTLELENAVREGVECINVDSAYELALINDIAGRIGRKVKVAIRTVPEVASYFKTGISSSKFGVELDRIEEVYRLALSMGNVEVAGIHVHLGSQIIDHETWTRGARAISSIVSRLHENVGLTLEHVNMGGGIPIDYTASPIRLNLDVPKMFDPDVTPEDVANILWDEISKVGYRVELRIEPGRSIVGDAGVLVTSVVNYKERASGDRWIILDSGFNLLPSVLSFHWYYPMINACRAGEEHDTDFRVGGPLCNGHDVHHDIDGEEAGTPRLPKYRKLPSSTRPGDIIALLHVGAYALDASSNYNSKTRPPAVLITRDGRVKLVRAGEDLEDLVRLDQL